MLVAIEIKSLKSIINLDFKFQIEKKVCAVIGKNGCGKSTLLNCIAKLVYPGIFQKEFAGNGYSDSSIKYTMTSINGDVPNISIEWQKTPHWRIHNTSMTYLSMPKITGFYEASLLNGTRFQNRQIFNHLEADVRPADAYIKNGLKNIIGDDNPDKFENLFYNQVAKRFALLKGEAYLDELEFSTGEYFLLSVLRQMNTLSRRVNKDTTAVLIIDEVEISLHPVAQQKFIDLVKEFSECENVFVFIATHSIYIVEKLDPQNVFLMRNNGVECTMSAPTSAGYMASQIYNYIAYDKIILVEDENAKIFVKALLDSGDTEINSTYTIIPIGGWEKVLQIAKENTVCRYFGNASVACVLDGDIMAQANRTKYNGIQKNFIPGNNIEKFFCSKIFSDNQFKSDFQRLFFNGTPIDSLAIEDIAEKTSDKIKNIFSRYIEKTSEYRIESRSVIKKEIIEFIIDKMPNREISSLSQFLSEFLSA